MANGGKLHTVNLSMAVRAITQNSTRLHS